MNRPLRFTAEISFDPSEKSYRVIMRFGQGSRHSMGGKTLPLAARGLMPAVSYIELPMLAGRAA